MASWGWATGRIAVKIEAIYILIIERSSAGLEDKAFVERRA
jgi:hypothetical protein